MAKSGTVAAAGTAAAIEDAVVKVEAPSMTLGQIVAAALTGSNLPEFVIVNLSNRTVEVFQTDNANAMAVIMEGSEDGIDIFAPDEESKVSPWTATPGTWAGSAPIVTPAKPARSVAALINAIEDYISAHPSETARVVCVDQVNGKVGVFEETAINPPDGVVPDATFTQTVEDSGSTIKNAFE